MIKQKDLRAVLCDANPEILDAFEIFGSQEDDVLRQWVITELDNIARTFVEDIAGFVGGEHFNLFVMNNNPPATMLTALLKCCTEHSVDVTIHYWNDEAKAFVVQEWTTKAEI